MEVASVLDKIREYFCNSIQDNFFDNKLADIITNYINAFVGYYKVFGLPQRLQDSTHKTSIS